MGAWKMLWKMTSVGGQLGGEDTETRRRMFGNKSCWAAGRPQDGVLDRGWACDGIWSFQASDNSAGPGAPALGHSGAQWPYMF